MPADQPRGPNRAWKQQAAAPGEAKAGKRAWQKTPDAPAAGPKRPWSRTSKLGLATFVLSAIVALMVVIILILRPAKPACLVLMGAPFEEDLRVPHNVYGWQGLKDLETLQSSSGATSWLPWSGSRPIHAFAPKEYDPKEGWIQRDISEETMVLFLALHGGSDPKNGAYLVVNSPKGPEQVPVKTILDALRTSPQLQNKKKILILDATQVLAHWPSGMVYNDFVHKLKELKQDIEKIDNLLVLCASDEDQRSWVSEEWRQTIFTHYIIEGLRGAADLVENGGDGNSRVTALELYKYVRKRVEAWARINREATQQPILLGGEDRAARIELMQNAEPYTEQSPDKAPGRDFKASNYPDLKTSWEDCARLSKQVPSPAVYTPQLWRRYQDTLLRYEQILRAGDPTRKAADLRASLGTLRNSVMAGRALGGVAASLTYTLPMPAEAGRSGPWTVEQKQELAARFKTLWNAPVAERQKTWDSLKDWVTSLPETRDDAAGLKLLQLQLTRLLLAQLAQAKGDAPPELAKGVDLLGMFEGAAPRPAEAQYLVLLQRDLDPRALPVSADKTSSPGKKTKPPPITASGYANTLRQAVGVSLLAERTAAGMSAASKSGDAHPYSEFLRPWIDTAVVKADEQRRKGVDYLFGPAGTWVKARDAFTAANTAYQNAGKDAETVRQALDVRDQVFAALPYFAQWAAARRSGATTTQDSLEVNDLLNGVEDLAGNMNNLTPLLEGVPQASNLATLKGIASEMNDKLQKLRSDFESNADQLGKQVADQVSYLARFEASLAAPLIEDAGLRMTLLEKSRTLTARFNAQPLNIGGATAKAADDAARASQALESARGQGRMAVAVTRLAKPWLETGNVDQMKAVVTNLQPGTKWHDDLAPVGEQIAARYQEMRQRTVDGWKESIDAKDLKTAVNKVVIPEALCRLIPGGASPLPPIANYDQAVDAARKLRFHDLLLWQAQRALDDHWFKGTEAPKETYYEPAADAYVKDAAGLVEAADEIVTKDRQKDAQAMKNKIVYAGVEAKGRPTQAVTSARDFSVSWTLGAKGLPDGSMPVFWLGVDRPVKPINVGDLDRKTLDPIPAEITYSLQKAAPGKQKEESQEPEEQDSKALLHGRFRGQRIEQTTVLKLYREPEIHVYRIPPPPKAGISLRMAPDFTYGAVSIVLDCSGSMKEDINKPGVDGELGKRKIDWAKKSLDEVLRKLPRGTWLSVFTFAQKKPAQSIYNLRPPEPWNPDAAVKGLKSLMADINDLEPYYETPLAETIGMAKKNGFPPPENYQGAKVIVVLTDGYDNLFDEAALANIANEQQKDQQRAKRINDYLDKEFNGGSTELKVICFVKKDSPDAKAAETQFGIIKGFDPPGQFQIEEQPAFLATSLEQALRPRLHLYKGDTQVASVRQGVPATAFGEDRIWKPVNPDFYTGRVQRIYSQEVQLDAGQLLNITLTQTDSQVFFKRGLLSDFVKETEGAASRGKWFASVPPWIVSVPQNQLVRLDGSLRQLVALETPQSEPARRSSEAPLRQAKPAFLWMELGVQGKPQRFLWQDEFGYPGASFLLQSPNWPRAGDNPAAPELKVWWSQALPAGDQKIIHSAGQLLGQLQKRFLINGNHVTLKKIGVELDRPVPQGMEGPQSQAKRPALVLEIEHDPGKPVWLVADKQLGFRGEEHMFYPSVGMYTAVFYGVANPLDVDFTLTLISLDDFKNSALHAPFNLNAPDPGDDGPQRKLDVLQ